MNSIKKISLGNVETQKEAAPTKYFPFYSNLNKIDYIKEMDIIKQVLTKEHVNVFHLHILTCEDKNNVYRILSNKELSAKMGLKRKSLVRSTVINLFFYMKFEKFIYPIPPKPYFY
ncbi:MAG TPA: hypothetical protein VIN73_01195 [Vicingaceae bacterium]